MERPERPSRHSKSHDKWKRIIEPAGDSDSSSDWSTDSDAVAPPPGPRSAHYFSQATEPSAASTAHPQSSSSTTQTSADRLDRLRSLLPNYSSLLARYGSNSSKRSLETAESNAAAHNYHLLHHDYAERESYRSLPSDNFPWFLRPSAANVDRKRQRLNRPPANEDPSDAAEDANNRDDNDNANLLYPLSISNNSNRSPGGASANADATPEDGNDMELDVECTTAPIVPTNNMPMRRCLSEHRYPTDLFDWEPPHYSTHRSTNSFVKLSKRSFGANAILSPSERGPQLTSTPVRGVEDASDVQVISMAGPSTSTAATLQRPIRKQLLTERLNAFVAASEEVIIVDDHQVSEVLSDPVETASVEELAAPVAEVKTRPRLEEETLNQGLIGLLECPVCMEYMSPPIHQCRRGHLVCVNCKPKLPLCPTCRSRLTDSRNLAMEKVADKLLYPCKNAHVSCLAQLRLKDKVDHEANCDHRTYRCSLPQCDWKGFKDELLPHNVSKHTDKLLFGNQQVLCLHLGDLSIATNQNWIVSSMDELFRVNFVTVKSGQRLFETGSCRMQVFGCVQYIGPQNKASNFEYTLETRKSSEQSKRCITFTRNCHKDLVKCAVNYSAGDSFYLRGDTAELLSDGTQGDVVLMVHLAIQPNKKETATAAQRGQSNSDEQ